MPSSYRIDVERGIVFTRAWGVITDAQITAHAIAIGSDPRHDPGAKQIVNLLELTDIQVTSGAIRDIARLNPFKRDARRAFVVGSNEAFGLTRMFGFFADASADQFAIFRALPPALEWIGLDPKEPWPDLPPDKTFDQV